MLENLNLREWEVTQPGKQEKKTYIPSNLNFDANDSDDHQEADDILDQKLLQIDDNPYLTEQQKNMMCRRLQDKVWQLVDSITYMWSDKKKEERKQRCFESLKELCNEDATILVSFPNGDVEMDINDFWAKVKSKEIKLKDYWVQSVRFNKGEFLEDRTVDWIDYRRKINKIKLVSNNIPSIPYIYWWEDIK